MTHRNDDKLSALETLTGSTGHIDNLEIEWLQSAGATSNQANKAWYEIFILGGATSLNWNYAAYQWLGILGYTGALPDRWAAYWAAGGGAGVYDPGMMTFDGSSYYDLTSVTTSGNKVTYIFQLNIASFSGGGFQRPMSVNGGTQWRGLIAIGANDHATVDYRDRMHIYIPNTVGTAICFLNSISSIADGADHTVVIAYDGDLGVASFRIDGNDEDDTGFSSRVLTTGTVESGSGSRIGVGASHDAGSPVTGKVGFVGVADAYLTYSDFMLGAAPIEQNETTWLPGFVGSQPLVWNADGDLHTSNAGSEGLFTKNGTITGPT